MCSRDPAEIVPNLFIGSVLAANNTRSLEENGIGAVLNVSRCDYSLPDGVNHLKIEVEDTLEANLGDVFETTNQWIHASREAGVPAVGLNPEPCS